MVLQKNGSDPGDAGRVLYVLRESADGPAVASRDLSSFDAVLDLPAYQAAVAAMAEPRVKLLHDAKMLYILCLSVTPALNTADDLIEL